MNIGDTLKRNNFEFSKAYGQNFITDENLLAAIAKDAGVTKDDTVIEIGAGAGTLTRALSKAAERVTAFEIDRTLKPVLDETLRDCTNTEVIFKDIMATDITEVESIAGKDYKVVANLPYYITTPIIFSFLENATRLKSMTLMVQKEVAERMTATEKKGDYGALSVAVQLYSDAKIVRIVGRDNFYPVPNVDSAIVRLDIKPRNENIDYIMLRRVIKAGFTMKRKTLVNNLMAGFAFNRETAEKVLSKCGFDLKIRADALYPQGFVVLAETIKEFLKNKH